MNSRLRFFASCAPGLEDLLQGELRALRLARVERQVGGVYFEGRIEDAWTVNLWSRVAMRVLVRVARFEVAGEDDLYAGARSVDWAQWLAPEGRLSVAAHASQSALDHTLYVRQRTKDAIVDQFRERSGTRPSVDAEEPDLAVHVHLVKNRCTLLIDSSGAPLYLRGWRRQQGRAPLAETLAAAIVLRSGWDRRAPLLDPFCGSGTLLVEGAWIAAGRAPGALRARFGFERWLGHDARAFERVRAAARAAGELPRKLVLRGSDLDPHALEAARANLAAAGLEGAVQLERADAREFDPKRGWNACIASNLPYGLRVGARGAEAAGLSALLRDFGARLRERAAGSQVALLCGSAADARQLALPGAQELPLQNGGLDCRLVLAHL